MRRISGSEPPAEPTPESLIENAARDAGFSLVGIANASPSPSSSRLFEKWTREGKHGGMSYLSRGSSLRQNPGLLLDGAKSAVCVAVDYYSRVKEEWNRLAAADHRGRVAVYAHGRDYHAVLSGMLQDLEGRLRKLFPGLRARAAVDTEPISERDFAIQAGIAWLGKNTCVISPEYGSWIFLGELITNLSLQPGTPLPALCGTCTKCIEACPTGALDGHVLDAKKCIAYLTIEKRGEIQAEFHEAIDGYLFGCDECQRVCPYNSAPRESLVFGGGDRNAVTGMRLEDLLGRSDGELKKLARGTVMERCKPEGIRRNAKIAAGNRSSPPRGEKTF